MFSGIVEEVGVIAEHGRYEGKLVVAAARVMSGSDGLEVSDSVSVSGSCFTVTELQDNWISLDVAPETYRRTWFDELHVGSHVNLERALRYGDRVGGHMVQGHVDGIGRVTDAVVEREAKLITVECSDEIARYVVEKGFVAVEGVSLTSFDCTPSGFTFTLIPYTAVHTTLGSLRIGDSVNIESDLTGKYVERFVSR